MLSDNQNINLSLSGRDTSMYSGWTTDRVTSKDYVATIAALSQLPGEVSYWTHCNTSGSYKSFTHQNI